ncbi:MAG: mechanosensitive ion channel [Candidatus Omnitrophica bacterium]|nr:mechanosensitive ion channel [Candidatus Omnitrophota bacterium]
MKRGCIKIGPFMVLAFLLVLFLSSGAGAQEAGTASENTTAASSNGAEAVKEELKQLEQEEAQTKEELEKTEESIEKVQEEAAQVAEEKQKAEAEALLLEQEAKLAREKAEALKAQAEAEDDRRALEEAEKLEAEAARLKEEADVSKQKLEMISVQEKLAQERIAANQAKIDELKEAIQGIRKEKTAKRSILEKLGIAGGSVLIGLVLFFLMNYGINRVEKMVVKTDEIREDEFSLRIRTLTKLFRWLGGIVITGIVVFMVLETFGFSLGPLLAGAGIIGLAFGFGGQYLIRDLINGIFILLEGQYRVNDVVKINDLGGLVEDINLRITTLRDLAGRVIIIPNGEIKIVINFTRGYAQALMDIGVAYKENVDKVMEVIKEVGAGMRKDPYFGRLILDDLEMLGVDEFADSAVMIKFRIKTRPIKQWEVSREFRRRIKNRFDELDIEIPFPHRTVYWGTGSDNDWFKGSMNGMAGAR